MYACFFIGHRDAPFSIQEQLNDIVEDLVRNHWVSHFVVGYHGNFDTMATIAVQDAKKRHPDLYAYRLLPYHPSECQLPLPEFFDDTFYPAGLETVPRRFCIKKANRAVLDESDFLVAYVTRDGGNAAELLRHARRMEYRGWIKVINLGATLPPAAL